MTLRTNQSENMPIHIPSGPMWNARISTTETTTRQLHMVIDETSIVKRTSPAARDA